MADSSFQPPTCPRCGSPNVTLCGRSLQYRPAERADQPLAEREFHTLAFKCECGLGFTTDRDDNARDARSN